MTAKRFMIDDCGTLIDMHTRDTFDYVSDVCDLLNEQHETIQRLNQNVDELLFVNVEKELLEENEQLKQDRNALIHLLENQSMIIEELHSKLLEYQVKEPIVLTKEDLNLMGKAIGYYTHGRCGE